MSQEKYDLPHLSVAYEAVDNFLKFKAAGLRHGSL